MGLFVQDSSMEGIFPFYSNHQDPMMAPLFVVLMALWNSGYHDGSMR